VISVDGEGYVLDKDLPHSDRKPPLGKPEYYEFKGFPGFEEEEVDDDDDDYESMELEYRRQMDIFRRTMTTVALSMIGKYIGRRLALSCACYQISLGSVFLSVIDFGRPRRMPFLLVLQHGGPC
jgi:hypothetical protein